MKRMLKRKRFARWQTEERLPDAALLASGILLEIPYEQDH